MSAADTLNRVSYLMNIIIGMLMFILGMIGSILIGLIFLTQRKFRTNSCIHYLLAGIISNVLMLINVLLPRIFADGFALPMYNANEFFCRERLYISSVASICAIYFPCWATFDQYASSSRNPIFRQRWSSIKFAHRAILITFLISIIIHIPHLIWNGIINGICMGLTIECNKFNAFVFVPIFYGLAPIILISFFTLNLRKNVRLTINLRSRNYRAKQIRRMLIPQLIVLAISGLPFSIQAAYAMGTSHINKDLRRRSIENLIYHIVRLLFYSNYFCTFYIYAFMSSEVRKNLWRLMNRFKRTTRIIEL